jgi:hypothetical protein
MIKLYSKVQQIEEIPIKFLRQNAQRSALGRVNLAGQAGIYIYILQSIIFNELACLTGQNLMSGLGAARLLCIVF